MTDIPVLNNIVGKVFYKEGQSDFANNTQFVIQKAILAQNCTAVILNDDYVLNLPTICSMADGKEVDGMRILNKEDVEKLINSNKGEGNE